MAENDNNAGAGGPAPQNRRIHLNDILGNRRLCDNTPAFMKTFLRRVYDSFVENDYESVAFVHWSGQQLPLPGFPPGGNDFLSCIKRTIRSLALHSNRTHTELVRLRSTLAFLRTLQAKAAAPVTDPERVSMPPAASDDLARSIAALEGAISALDVTRTVPQIRFPQV